MGFEGGLGFWGGNKIIDNKGKILSRLGLFTKGNLNFDIKGASINTLLTLLVYNSIFQD